MEFISVQISARGGLRYQVLHGLDSSFCCAIRLMVVGLLLTCVIPQLSQNWENSLEAN